MLEARTWSSGQPVDPSPFVLSWHASCFVSGAHVAVALEVLMRLVCVASVLVLAGTYGVLAHAQEVAQASYFEKTMSVPDRAFELNVSTAYNQGWGDLTDAVSVEGQTFGRRVQDVAGAGLALELDLGYRASPTLAGGFYGTVAQYTNQTEVSGTKIRSLTAGIQGQWYVQPFRAFSPWMTIGTAYRASWIVPDVGANTLRKGWQIARLQFGTDFRLSREIAIAPFIGGDINVMFSESLPNGDSRNLDGAPTFVSFTAGILGRFDIGEAYVTPGGTVAHRE
jgi:hypothetical protein